MANFDQDIQNYKRYGTYTYKFDNVGNVVLNPSSSNFSQVYVAFPLQNAIFDNSKIETMYNVKFEEFIPKTETTSSINVDDLLQQITTIQTENETLKSQLDSVVVQSETATDADQLAAKQVILELRKALGEGALDTHFSDTFPYTPIRKDVA
jgi:hypothetical protein